MSMLFPSPFKSTDSFSINNEKLGYTVDSGKNALRIAIRSFNLEPKSKIAIPAFSCNAVYQSVIEENHLPFFLDLKSDNTYWADCNSAQLLNNEVKVLILTHLYGFLHPDTEAFVEFCKTNNIKIIHDAAQSYGLSEKCFGDDIFVYSYSAGKSTTAAGGGEICNLCDFKVGLKPPSIIEKIKAKSFFNSRYVDFNFPKFNVRLIKLLSFFKSKSQLFSDMSDYQKMKAKQAKQLVKQFPTDRELRYNLLKKAIEKNNALQIAYDHDGGLYFKIVLFCKYDVDKFIAYLQQNSIPHYRLAMDINISERGIKLLPIFTNNYFNFVEISTERTVGINQINRIAELLANYK